MEETEFQTGFFKGESALFMENDSLKATILHQRGCKIASLEFKQDGIIREALAQIPTEEFTEPVTYGKSFEAEDGTGFDDMFPNISSCTYDEYPWQNILLPDHGEVWTLPWDYQIDGKQLECSVNGLRLPYTLTKSIRLNGQNLTASYRAVNNSAHPFPFQWAAHAILAMSSDSRLEVPQEQKRIINAYPGNRLHVNNKEYDFPFPDGPGGFDLTKIPVYCKTGVQKYWFTDPVTEGWCRLINPNSGLITTMTYSKEILCYLGIWINEGGWKGCYNMGIEPSTCRGDNPISSNCCGYGSRLPARGMCEWEISLSLKTIDYRR